MIDRREIELLRSLLRSGSGALSSDLVEQLGGDASTLQTVIEALMRDGYRLEQTGETVRLRSEPDAVRTVSPVCSRR